MLTIQEQILPKARLVIQQTTSVDRENRVIRIESLPISPTLQKYFTDHGVIYACFYLKGEGRAVSFMSRRFNNLLTVVYEEDNGGINCWLPPHIKTFIFLKERIIRNE